MIFFLLNVLPGVYVAQPDPFIFANIKSNLKNNTIVINMAEPGEDKPPSSRAGWFLTRRPSERKLQELGQSL